MRNECVCMWCVECACGMCACGMCAVECGVHVESLCMLSVYVWSVCACGLCMCCMHVVCILDFLYRDNSIVGATSKAQC